MIIPIDEKCEKVKRLYETEDYFVVNSLLKDNWILLGVYHSKNKVIYVLGYTPKEK